MKSWIRRRIAPIAVSVVLLVVLFAILLASAGVALAAGPPLWPFS